MKRQPRIARRAVVSLGLCALLLPAIGPTPAAAQLYDHLKCYKIKDAASFTSAVTLQALQAQFGVENCTVLKSKLFCVPVDKEVTGFQDRTQPPLNPDPSFAGQALDDDRICYKIKCPQVSLAPLQVTDQFGTRNVEKFKPQFLCTPAFLGAPTTTTLPPLPPCAGGSPWPSCVGGDCSLIGASHFCDPRPDSTCSCVRPCNELDPSGGDICGTGGCPVDSRCALLPVLPAVCGCVPSLGS